MVSWTCKSFCLGAMDSQQFSAIGAMDSICFFLVNSGPGIPVVVALDSEILSALGAMDSNEFCDFAIDPEGCSVSTVLSSNIFLFWAP